ncbi:MAG TPA: SRPBCC domain-containing protein [Thermoleophilaceae bacterium]|nr:SRPBCC domain-containing protein [Thermoleophilaceae bacterium]
MKLEHSFQVAAPLDTVWEALIDVQRVAPCLPGAEITEAGEDGTYRGTFSVRLGPTTAAYRGQLAMEEVDEPAHRAVMRASGQDKRGQGSAKATIVSTMREEGEATTVEVETDFTITGRLARFGRGGMIQDVSNRLLRDFAECLQKTIEASRTTPEAAAAGPPGTPEAAGGEQASTPETAASEPGGGEGLPGQGPPEAGTPTAAPPAAGSATSPARTSATPPAPRAKPVGGFSLLFRALLDRIRRALRRRR